MNYKIMTFSSLALSIILLGLWISTYFHIDSKKQEINYQAPFEKKHIDQIKSLVDNGSVFIVDENNQVLLNYHGNESFIPASTLKIITSLASLTYLGKDFRFFTQFNLDSNQNLYIKGFGDPTLTSKELRIIVQKLKEKGLTEINSIYLDGSYFASFVKVPGNEDTYKAYDSKNSALSANYNTIAFKRVRSKLISGEKETPLIPFAKKILNKAKLENKKLKRKKEFRIAIKDEKDSLLYFGHLFKEFCKEASVKVTGSINIKKTPSELPVFYRHHSSTPLLEVIKNLLDFSNNYTANQILLVLGTHLKHNPATLEKGVSALLNFLEKELNIVDIKLSEGSGLSYANKVTTQQMIKVLEHFRPYKDLLKEVEPNVYAKSGGLKTVMSLVGFMDTPRFGEVKFAIILNQSSNNKPHLLKILIETLF